MPPAFACPPDCGYCCTHLTRDKPDADVEFREMLRDEGVYSCRDALGMGLSLSNEEAAALVAEAARRKLRADIHPRTFLLETRRRLVVPLDWHLPHVACPFYAGYKCTAYDKRPLVCRAFPVLAPSPAWRLAPQCPLSEPTRASGARLGTLLRVESAARRALDREHARLDEIASSLTARADLRFAIGLTRAEANERARRYRVATPASLGA